MFGQVDIDSPAGPSEALPSTRWPRINMYVNLPHEFKGTHMSRFIEVLNKYHGEIGINNFLAILDETQDRAQRQGRARLDRTPLTSSRSGLRSPRPGG